MTLQMLKKQSISNKMNLGIVIEIFKLVQGFFYYYYCVSAVIWNVCFLLVRWEICLVSQVTIILVLCIMLSLEFS